MANSWASQHSGRVPVVDLSNYVPVEYPKWVHPAGKPPLIVHSRDEEDAVMAVEAPAVEAEPEPTPVIRTRRAKQ